MNWADLSGPPAGLARAGWRERQGGVMLSLILMGGWPGSGRSTLSVELGSDYLTKDEFKEAEHQVAGQADQLNTHARVGVPPPMRSEALRTSRGVPATQAW